MTLAFVLEFAMTGCGPAFLNDPSASSAAKANRPDVQSGPVLKEYPLLGSKLQGPFALAFDYNQRLWFNSFYQYLGMMRSDGQLVAHRFQKWSNKRLPVSGGSMILGPDHRVWFTDFYDENFGVVESTGRIKQYKPFGTAYGYAYTSGIVTARGYLWMLVIASYGPGAALVELDTKPSVISVISLPGGDCWPESIVADASGTLWITNPGCPKITRVATDGHVTDFPLPGNTGAAWGMASGPDGNIWFTVAGVTYPYVGKITPHGKITTYPLSAGTDGDANGITLGPDGNWWITMPFIGEVFTMSLSGEIQAEYPLPGRWKHSAPKFQTGQIILGPDGNLWFAEASRNKLGEFKFSK